MNVGVLVNPQVTRWHERAIENVRELDDVEITLVVENADHDSMMEEGADAINRDSLISLEDVKLFYKVLSEERLKAALYADQKLGWDLFGETKQRDWLRTKRVDEVDALADAERVRCEPITDGAWNRFPDDVVDEIAEKCDVVLRFGFGLIEGDVLTAPEHGVLSIHGSDIRKYRGMGPQLAFLKDEDRVTVTLQRLTEDIDAGSIVTMQSAEVSENATYDEVSGEILRVSTEIFADGVAKLRDGGSPWEPDSLGTYYSLDLQRTSPRFVGKLLLKNNYYRIKNALGDDDAASASASDRSSSRDPERERVRGGD